MDLCCHHQRRPSPLFRHAWPGPAVFLHHFIISLGTLSVLLSSVLGARGSVRCRRPCRRPTWLSLGSGSPISSSRLRTRTGVVSPRVAQEPHLLGSVPTYPAGQREVTPRPSHLVLGYDTRTQPRNIDNTAREWNGVTCAIMVYHTLSIRGETRRDTRGLNTRSAPSEIWMGMDGY